MICVLFSIIIICMTVLLAETMYFNYKEKIKLENKNEEEN